MLFYKLLLKMSPYMTFRKSGQKIEQLLKMHTFRINFSPLNIKGWTET